MLRGFKAPAISIAGIFGLIVTSMLLPALADQPTGEVDKEAPSMEYRNAVKAAAQNWLGAMASEGFMIETGPLKANYRLNDSNPRLAYITSSNENWQITLGFSEPISSTMTILEVQQRLDFFAHDGFPTPGLQKRHWNIRALTPSSHLGEGVEVLEVDHGLLKLRVRAEFFALYGIDARVNIPADASAPDNAYFQINKTFVGEVIILLEVANF